MFNKTMKPGKLLLCGLGLSITLTGSPNTFAQTEITITKIKGDAAVVDKGSADGLKRNDQLAIVRPSAKGTIKVGTAIVVEVRDHLAGIRITETVSGKVVQVGDRLIKTRSSEDDLLDAMQSSQIEKPSESKVQLYANKPPKNPGTALGLSIGLGFIGVHGTGQLYNGEIGKAMMFFTAGVAGARLATLDSEDSGATVAGVIVYLTSYIWSSIDAHKSAKHINRERGFSFTPGESKLALSLYSSPQQKVNWGLKATVAF